MKAAGRPRPALTGGALFLLAGLWALPALAQVEATVGNQLSLYYDTSVEQTVLDDRFDALLHHGPFRLGVTFLSHDPSDYSRLDPHNFGPPQNKIRKRFLEAEEGNFHLRLGNVYQTFGRGLALQVYEDRTIDFDNALDGVSGQADLGPLRLALIGGSNAFGDQALVIKGGSASCALPLGLHLGSHMVWADYQRDLGRTHLGEDQLYGGFLQSASVSWADLYGEYVVRHQPDLNLTDGHAAYADLNLYLGPLQILAEGKDLLRYDLPQVAKEDGTAQAFVHPPTAVRQHSTTLLNRASHVAHLHPEDEQGVLLEGYLNLQEKTHLVASYSSSRARHALSPADFQPPYGYRATRLPAWETYGEIEHWFTEEVELVLRADETEETVNKGGVPTFFERITGGATLVVPLAEGWTCDLTQESQGTQETNYALDPDRFTYKDTRDHLVSLTVSRAPGMSWGLTTEWTTDRSETHRSWLWAEWSLRLSERHQMTLGAGRLRGGQLCSGGVCKIVAPFEGGRVELTTNF